MVYIISIEPACERLEVQIEQNKKSSREQHNRSSRIFRDKFDRFLYSVINMLYPGPRIYEFASLIHLSF
jgi:hypothetical protein